MSTGGARVDDHDRPRVGTRDASHELVLLPGEGERLAVESLALGLLGRSDDDDGDIALPRERLGPRELRLGRAPRRLEVQLQPELGDVDGGIAAALGPEAQPDRDLLTGDELDRDAALGRAQRPLPQSRRRRERQRRIEPLDTVEREGDPTHAGGTDHVLAGLLGA